MSRFKNPRRVQPAQWLGVKPTAHAPKLTGPRITKLPPKDARGLMLWDQAMNTKYDGRLSLGHSRSSTVLIMKKKHRR